MNDYLSKHDNRTRNDKYRHQLDLMNQIKDGDREKQLNLEREEVAKRSSDVQLATQIEVQEKELFRKRNEEMLRKGKEEQEEVSKMAREVKMAEEAEFRQKLELMKQQEEINRIKEAEYKNMMIKDMHENYEISKKVTQILI